MVYQEVFSRFMYKLRFSHIILLGVVLTTIISIYYNIVLSILIDGYDGSMYSYIISNILNSHYYNYVLVLFIIITPFLLGVFSNTILRIFVIIFTVFEISEIMNFVTRIENGAVAHSFKHENSYVYI